jgi:hypothetical protein
MRRLVLATLVACVACPVPSSLAASHPILRLSTVGQFGTTPYPSSAIVSELLTTGAPLGQSFYARTAGPGSDDHDPSLSSLGFSSEPLQVSMDPRRNASYQMVYSRCGGTGATLSCGLFARARDSQEVDPTPVTPGAIGTRDRLPSTYGGATAFARSTAGSTLAELRYVATVGGISRKVPAGPATKDAEPIGIALHGHTLAYVWSWRTTTGSHTSLRLYTPGARTRTLLTLPSTRGRIIGPTWQKRQLVFAVRRNGSSTWYRFDPSTTRYSSARGPRNLIAVAAADRYLYWETGSTTSLRSGLCPAGDCGLWLDQPSFHRSSRPR